MQEKTITSQIAELEVKNRTMLDAWYAEETHPKETKRILSRSNRDMIAKLAAIERVASDNKIKLDPFSANTDRFLKEHTGNDYNISDGFQRLSEITDPSISKIPRKERWQLCIDPQTVDEIERSPLAGDLRALRPLVFDDHANPFYFQRMATTWKSVCARPQEPINANFLVRLNQSCSGSSINDSKRGIFGLHYGSNLTDAGHAELKDFCAAFTPPIHNLQHVEGEGINLIREQMSKSALIDLMEGFLENHTEKEDGLIPNYREKLSSTPEAQRLVSEMDDLRIKSAIKVCQNLERLHPSFDGNARAFGVFLINRLLTEQNQTFTLLDNPNKLDGHSVDEVFHDVRKGQERFQKLTHLPRGKSDFTKSIPGNKPERGSNTIDR